MAQVEGERHWHGLYKKNNKTTKRNRSKNKIRTNVFGRHFIGFEKIALDAEKRGIEIINCSPKSAIKEFRKVNAFELL